MCSVLRSLLRLLVALCVTFALVPLANAQTKVYPPVFMMNGTPFTSGQAACAGQNYGAYTFSHWGEIQPGTAPAPLVYGWCYASLNGQAAISYLNANSTCPAASVLNEVLHQCIGPDSPCNAGEKEVKNYTVGWSLTPTADARDLVAPPANPPVNGCDGKCAEVLVQQPVECWRSQVPAATGLHRVSCDYNVTKTGGTCSTPTPGSDPTTPPLPCPGYTGYVNGKAVCVGSPSTPLPKNPPLPGTPPEGYGNPAAGGIPSTGPGSGTGPAATPASPGPNPGNGPGGGSPSGGGSNAATPGGGSDGNGQVSSPGTGTTGGSGTGTGTCTGANCTPTQDPCGLPGRPACKIDETGTPDGLGAYSAAGQNITDSMTQGVQRVNDSANKLNTLPWIWGFQLPVGTCSLIDMTTRMGPFTIDICTSPLATIWRALLGYMVATLGALYCWRSITGSSLFSK